jgi:hypothetical protein
MRLHHQPLKDNAAIIISTNLTPLKIHVFYNKAAYFCQEFFHLVFLPTDNERN